MASRVPHGELDRVVVGRRGGTEGDHCFEGGVARTAGTGPLRVESCLWVVVVVLHAGEFSQRCVGGDDADGWVDGLVVLGGAAGAGLIDEIDLVAPLEEIGGHSLSASWCL